jgi:hypothetical protein
LTSTTPCGWSGTGARMRLPSTRKASYRTARCAATADGRAAAPTSRPRAADSLIPPVGRRQLRAAGRAPGAPGRRSALAGPAPCRPRARLLPKHPHQHQSKGYAVAIASANDDVSKIAPVLGRVDGSTFNDGFYKTSAFQVGQADKSQEMRRIAEWYRTPAECIMLFDDSEWRARAPRAGFCASCGAARLVAGVLNLPPVGFAAVAQLRNSWAARRAVSSRASSPPPAPYSAAQSEARPGAQLGRFQLAHSSARRTTPRLFVSHAKRLSIA